RPARNGSGSSRICLMSSMRSSHLHVIGFLLGRGGRAGRSRRGLSGGGARRGARVHDALPMEDAALLDHEGLGGDVPVDTTAASEVRLPLDEDVALETAGDADVLSADVGLDLALWRQADVAVGVDLTLHLAVDPERARGDEVALQASACTDDRDLTVVRHVRVLSLLRSLRGWCRMRRLGVFSAPDHFVVTASCWSSAMA